MAQYELRCAKRIAQTERNRVQSQARYQAGEEAKAKGVNICNEWSARMVNTRETHAALNGQRVMQGEKFHLSDGDELQYPGDPNGRACNVINCYCVMIPHVLLPGERLVDGEVDKGGKNVIISNETNGTADGYTLYGTNGTKIKITDEAINRVPTVSHEAWSATMSKAVNDACRNVLRLAHAENQDNETAIGISGDGLRVSHVFGNEQEVSTYQLQSVIGQKGSVVVHNHPTGASISMQDFANFFLEDQLSAIIAVKNNGELEMLSRTADYDGGKMNTRFLRAMRGVNLQSEAECTKAMDKFLRSLDGKDGVLWTVK